VTELASKLGSVRKRIDGLDLKITKLNSAIAKDKRLLDELENTRCAKSNEQTAAAMDLEEEMERLRKEAEAMEVARHIALDSVRQADSRLTEWEDKVRYATLFCF
jgi:chromosome segregation ATPase